MGPRPLITPEAFTTSTTPEKTTSAKARSSVPSHVGRPRPHRESKASVLTWRFGPAPAFQRRQKQLTATSQDEIATEEQTVAEQKHILDTVPTSLNVRPSLQQFFAGNPFFFLPGQVMLDAGSPSAAAFFQTVDFKDIYHAIMGMFLSWLSSRWPSTHPISAALQHRAKAIPILRRRLAQGLHDNETYLSILCAMQTEALLGNEMALVAHQRGLEILSQSMTGKFSDYCRYMKIRHEYLVQKAGQAPPSAQEGARKTRTLQYPTHPYPKYVISLISVLPSVFQELAYQEYALSLDMITYLADFTAWATQAVVNSDSVSITQSLDSGGPQYAMLTELWHILGGLDPRSAPLERIFCIAHYLLMTSSYYHQFAQRTRVYRALRTEATALVLAYKPQSQPERKNLIFHGMLIVSTWKTTNVLQDSGLHLLANLQDRFPEMRQWETFEALMNMYPLIPAARAEWSNYWLQGAQSKGLWL